jgi:hypothetical protein
LSGFARGIGFTSMRQVAQNEGAARLMLARR